MFKILTLTTAAAITVAALLALSGPTPQAVDAAAETTPPTIRMLQDRSELTVLCVEVATVVTARKPGLLGSVKCCMIVNGIATVGTDLSKARFEHINPRKRSATLVMAEPRLMHVGFNGQTSRVYDITRTGLYRLAPFSVGEDKLINQALARAHDQLVDSVNMPVYRPQAKRRAETVVRQLARDVGWTLTVTWEPADA
jgi:hypothetical protein